jgi:hypothetical protein
MPPVLLTYLLYSACLANDERANAPCLATEAIAYFRAITCVRLSMQRGDPHPWHRLEITLQVCVGLCYNDVELCCVVVLFLCCLVCCYVSLSLTSYLLAYFSHITLFFNAGASTLDAVVGEAERLGKEPTCHACAIGYVVQLHAILCCALYIVQL